MEYFVNLTAAKQGDGTFKYNSMIHPHAQPALPQLAGTKVFEDEENFVQTLKNIFPPTSVIDIINHIQQGGNAQREKKILTDEQAGSLGWPPDAVPEIG
jgi:hypothetical protein